MNRRICIVQGNKSPMEVATEVAKEADEYNGFNLILADLTRNVMVYVSNRPKGQPATIQLVSPGLHVMSNARLDIPWQKVTEQLHVQWTPYKLIELPECHRNISAHDAVV